MKTSKNQLIALTDKNLGRILVDRQRDRHLDGSSRSYIDYATTNYLGWDFHPRFAELGMQRHREWGSLSGWSRLEIDAGLYTGIESQISSLVGGRETVLSHTITITNFSIIPGIARNGMIFCDKKVHAVVWESCRLARDHGAKLVNFPHQDLASLEEQLRLHKDVSPKLICVDGVYSISAEYADIRGLQALCEKYDAWLYVDDAHGFGILGRNPIPAMPYGFGGGGVVRHCAGNMDRTFYVSSMGKAFCTHTAFVCVPNHYREAVRENCMQYIYSAPLPPFVMGMVEAAIELNASEGDLRRKRIFELTKKLVDGMRSIGLDVQNQGHFPILFWKIGDIEGTAAVAEKLFAKGIIAGLRAYPVVPPNECGFRFGVTALHSEADIDETLRVLKDLAEATQRTRKAG